MDPQIIFQGIECPTLKLQAKTVLEELVQLCPSDSAIMATFQHIQNDFLAEIRVASENVYMQAKDNAGALTDCLDHVRTKLMGQITEWRSHRF